MTAARRVATATAKAHRAADAAARALAERDEAIAAMRADGATLRAIAAVAGITHVGVAKILKSRVPSHPELTPDGNRG